MATSTRKARHDSIPNRDEYTKIGTRGASKAAISTQQYGVVAGMRTIEREEEKEEEAFVFSDDQDTAAGDDSWNGASGRDGSESSAAHGPTCSLQAGRRWNDSDLRGSPPGINDTISELSCSGIFTIPSTVGDDQGNEDQSSDESTHDSSSESPNQTRVATPREDDDIGASHVEHLIQERRRWKLRAFESEHELAAVRSSHARMERRGSARAMEPRSADATMLQASGSFSAPISSETSAVEPGFDPDDRWQAASGIDGAPSSSSCSAAGVPSAGGARRPRGFFDTASDAQFWGAASATTDCLSASGAGRGAAGLKNDRQNRLVDGLDTCGGKGKDGATQQQIEGTGDDNYHELLCRDGEQGRNATRTHQLLRNEIAELKENLRKAELGHAAAEATAASVLQRARAAELSRDVKEIQVKLVYYCSLKTKAGREG